MTTGEDALLLSPSELEQLLAGINIDLSGILSPLEGPLEFIIREVVRWSVWVGEHILRFLVEVGGAFWNFLKGVFAPLFTALAATIFWLSDILDAWVHWLWDMVRPLLQDVVAMAGSILAAVTQPIFDIAGGLARAILEIPQAIYGFFTGGVNYLGTYIESITWWLGEKIEAGVTRIRDEIADPITDFFLDLPERIGGFFQPVIDFFVFPVQFWRWFFEGNPLDKVAYGLETSMHWVSEEIYPRVEAGIDALLGWIERFAPMSPDQAMPAARGIFRLGALSLGGLTAMTVAGELLHPLKQLGLGNIAAVIHDLIGYNAITGVIMGTAISSTLRFPLQYHFNRLFRPMIPMERDISEMYAKKEITQEQFDLAMAHHGYGDSWLDVYHRYIWKDPRLFEVIRIAEISFPDPRVPAEGEEWLRRAGLEEGIGPDWWYWIKMGKAGYDTLDIPILVNVAKMAVARREQTLFLMQVRRLLRDGFIDRAEAEKLVRDGWRPRDPIEFRLAGMALEARYERASETASIVLRGYSRGLFDEREASNILTSTGMAGDRAALLILQAKLGMVSTLRLRMGEPAEEPMRGQLLAEGEEVA